MHIFNVIAIVSIVVVILIIIICFIRWSYKKEEEPTVNPYDLIFLKNEIKETIQNILSMRPEELNLNKFETEKRISSKSKLRAAIRNCNSGDIGAKVYILDYISNLLTQKLNINQNNIEQVIAFSDPDQLRTSVKFQILLYQMKQKYGQKALEYLILENKLDEVKLDDKGSSYFEISEEDINRVYYEKKEELSFVGELDILVQMIYQMYLGHGVIDEIRDMHIDGVSAGVSGIPIDWYNYSEEDMVTGMDALTFSYDSIWIFFKGKSIHLSFLSFETQKELERICKNVYRFNNPGQLTEERGHIENDMKDGSRVVVVRPPFSDSWAFLIRKHNMQYVDINDLITDKNKEVVMDTMKWLIKGCQVLAITGTQGCGKTTLLRSLIQYINSTYNLRIQELIFELYLRKLYPKRNILTFKELPNVSGQEGLDVQKKTDGAVNILGEVATAKVATWVIQMGQVASRFTMFTHHAKTTSNLVDWMRNALLTDGGFSNERIAEEQVVKVLNFDIHMETSAEGHRYIQRITEIIPMEDFKYRKSNIIEFQSGGYVKKEPFSSRAQEEILSRLSVKEGKEFMKFIGEAYE